MSDLERKIEQFITKILEIQQARSQQPLSQSELQDIATDLGVTDSDWKYIEQVYQGHYKRGNGFLNHQNWEDALDELKQAHAIKPYEVSVLYDLALTYQGLWKEGGKKQHKKSAIHYARQCLTIKADHSGALQMLSDFRRKIFSLQRNKKRKESFKEIRGWGVFFMITIAFIIFANWILSTDHPSKSRNKQADLTQPLNAHSENTPREENIELPVELVQDQKSKGLMLQIESSIYEVRHTKNSVNYFKFLGDLTIQDHTITLLYLKVEILNQQDSIIHTDHIKAVWDLSTTFRPGDVIPLNYSQTTKDIQETDWKSIRFKVDAIKKQALPSGLAKENYPQIEVKWKGYRSKNFDIQIRERERSIDEIKHLPSARDRVYEKPVLEIKNTGKYPINKLILEVKWYDQKDKELSTKVIKPNLSWMPTFKPGQKRVYTGTHITLYDVSADDIKYYQIIVKEIN